MFLEVRESWKVISDSFCPAFRREKDSSLVLPAYGKRLTGISRYLQPDRLQIPWDPAGNQ